jgi:hypothetical protein
LKWKKQMFNKETYTVYVPKEQIGDSPYSTESPRTQMTTQTQRRPLAQRAVVGGIAYMAVSRSAQGVKTELEATARNRGTVKRINAASQLLAYGTAYIAGGPVGLATVLAGEIITSSVQEWNRFKEAQRYEQDKAFERTLKGAKATFGMGGSAYD